MTKKDLEIRLKKFEAFNKWEKKQDPVKRSLQESLSLIDELYNIVEIKIDVPRTKDYAGIKQMQESFICLSKLAE
jgi:hypothetical protein